jgi:cytochrome c-type biogenesis protein CcmH
MRALLFVTLLFCANAFAQAPQPGLVTLSPELEVRIKKLETELRCLVCQNQTLADSPAGLAGDLRRELRSLMAAGKSDDDIKGFLQARYGDFVLYNPPIKTSNFLLWFGPFMLLGLGALGVALMVRKRAKQMGAVTVVKPSAAESDAARLLMDDK